jgi:hypothetical protein
MLSFFFSIALLLLLACSCCPNHMRCIGGHHSRDQQLFLYLFSCDDFSEFFLPKLYVGILKEFDSCHYPAT